MVTGAGVKVVGHENVLPRMSNGPGAYPSAGVAHQHLFVRAARLFFNDEPVVVIHAPAARTDGDSIVFFRRSDVISAGDLFLTTSYPVIDPARGGSLAGIIGGLNQLLDLMVPRYNQEGGTYVIPGHGRVGDQHDVLEYRDMLVIVRDRVRAAVRKGQTLAQVKAARPTLDYDARWGAHAGWTRIDSSTRSTPRWRGSDDANPTGRPLRCRRLRRRVAARSRRAQCAAAADAPKRRATSPATGCRWSARTGTGGWSRRARATTRACRSTSAAARPPTPGIRRRRSRPTRASRLARPRSCACPAVFVSAGPTTSTLLIDTDAGQQTRRLRFGRLATRGWRVTRRGEIEWFEEGRDAPPPVGSGHVAGLLGGALGHRAGSRRGAQRRLLCRRAGHRPRRRRRGRARQVRVAPRGDDESQERLPALERRAVQRRRAGDRGLRLPHRGRRHGVVHGDDDGGGPGVPRRRRSSPAPTSARNPTDRSGGRRHAPPTDARALLVVVRAGRRPPRSRTSPASGRRSFTRTSRIACPASVPRTSPACRSPTARGNGRSVGTRRASRCWSTSARCTCCPTS